MAGHNISQRLSREEEILNALGRVSPGRAPALTQLTFRGTQPDPLQTVPTIEGQALSAPRQPSAFQRARDVKPPAKLSGKQTLPLVLDARDLLGEGGIQETLLGLAPLQAQKRDVESLRELARAQAEVPIQDDISPILALIDAQTGSKLLKSFTPPESVAKRQTRIMDSAAKTSAASTAAANSFLQGISKLKFGQVIKTIGEGGTVANIKDRLSAIKPIEARATTNIGKLVAESAKNSTLWNNLRAAMIDPLTGKPNIAGINASIAPIARNFSTEVGVLTNPDIARAQFETLRGKIGRLIAFVTANPLSERFRPLVTEALKLADIAQASFAKAQKIRLESFRQTALNLPSRKLGGFTEEDINGIYRPGAAILDQMLRVPESRSDKLFNSLQKIQDRIDLLEGVE